MQTKNKQINIIVNFAMYLIAAYLLYYTTSRAIKLAYTHDESFSYLHFMHKSINNIMLNHNGTANNHILNTLLMRLFSWLFNNKELFLRLSTLLSHALYLIISFKFTQKISSPTIRIAGFILLNINPYFLDFFSLSRGYGLAFGFIMLSNYLLYQYCLNKKSKNITLSVISGALAVYSSFSTLYYYIALISAIILITSIPFFKRKTFSLPNIFIKYKYLWITNLVLLALIFEPIRQLIDKNEFYGQGENSFWDNTVRSILIGTSYTYNHSHINFNIIIVLIKLVIVVQIILSFFELRKNSFEIKKSPLALSTLILVLTALCELLHHYITGAQFITMRVALFYWILFHLAFIHLNSFEKNHKKLKIKELIFVVLAIIYSIHFFKTKNLTHCYEWKYDSSNKIMLSILEKEVKSLEKTDTVRLGINWVFEPSLNYYIQTKEINWLKPVHRNGYTNGKYDYYYVFSSDSALIDSSIVIERFNIPSTVLLKKR